MTSRSPPMTSHAPTTSDAPIAPDVDFRKTADFAYFVLLASLTAMIVFSAYRSRHDAAALAFMLFCYIDMLSLVICFKWLEKLEPDGSPDTRLRLKAAGFALATALGLAFVWRMGLDMPWNPAVVLWSMSGVFGCYAMSVYWGCEHTDEHTDEHDPITPAESAYLFLMIPLTIMIAISAYRSRHDTAALAFLLFCYVDLLSLVICLKWLEKLEPDGSPVTRLRLRVAGFALATALGLAFVWRVGLYIPLPGKVVFCSMSTVLVFYAMLVYWGCDSEQTDEPALLPV